MMGSVDGSGERRCAMAGTLIGCLVTLGCGNGTQAPSASAGGSSASAGATSGGSAGRASSTGGTGTGGTSSNAGTTARGGTGAGNGTGGSGGAPSSGGSTSTSGGSGPAGGMPATGGTTAGGAGTASAAAGTGSGAGGSGAGTAGSGAGGASGAGTGGTGTAGSGGMPLVYDKENTGSDCTVATSFPAFSALTPIANLPDPFLSDSGTRISKRDDWRCRRAEIGAQVQHWGSGPKGAPPPSVTATVSGGKLSVVVSQGGASITLSATLTLPSGAGPFPLIIGMNTPTGSLPSSIFSGMATLTFDSSELVPDAFNVPRGAGTYFTMYPDNNAGAMIEWAWGVSRLIDGLYQTADQTKIDLNHIGLTGCSYQGKMALYAGAFDERIALTIPEESGGGGEASWRFMSTQTGTEDLDAAQGTAWYAANLLQFHDPDAPKLSYDQHELVAMIAPRAVLAVENTAIDRLGSQAGSVSMKAATEVYKALGIPDRIGFTQAMASAHCSFPSSQTPDVQAFVNKFLLGKDADTNIAKSSYDTDMSKWITWDTPELQ
ncbi:MAG TPA: hypothetical protein VMI54_04895 [Polyangiaceae bacterium]|nr:hypothetical protein [Polyangiaceae bacterium]